MKGLLKNLGASALLLCMVGMARAQDRQMPSAETRAAKMTDWMKTSLNLTADQQTKVQDLNLKYAVKMDSLRNSPQARQDKFTVMKSNDAARDAEFQSILTDEQYKTYQEKKQEMKGRFKEKAKDSSQ
jgi:hypothetical protein